MSMPFKKLPARRPLAACLAAALALGGCEVSIAAPAVTNCADSGAGSLRAAVAAAGDNDTIDLTGLTCSSITLVTGRIDTTHVLTIKGAGPEFLTIDANHQDRAFNHAGIGQLTLQGMSITDGFSEFGGGCIYAQGTLTLRDSTVSGCRVTNISDTARHNGGAVLVQGDLFVYDSLVTDNAVASDLGESRGGGLYATGDMVISDSTLSENRARSASGQHYFASGGAAYALGNMDIRSSIVTGNAAETSISGFARGGGLFAHRSLVAKYDTISDNRATSPFRSGGGGVATRGHAYMVATTISGNQAGTAGGVELLVTDPEVPSVFFNTTISENRATDFFGVGGIYSMATLTLQNCTVAFNSTERSGVGGVLASYYGIELQGTIVAGNTNASVPGDIKVSFNATITGSHNLIGATEAPVPADTIQGDARLAPLADNGGTTLTHALLADSPAIDHGNNAHQWNTDQRGAGFARELGLQPDIGAFEFDPDPILSDGFD